MKKIRNSGCHCCICHKKPAMIYRVEIPPLHCDYCRQCYLGLLFKRDTATIRHIKPSLTTAQPQHGNK